MSKNLYHLKNLLLNTEEFNKEDYYGALELASNLNEEEKELDYVKILLEGNEEKMLPVLEISREFLLAELSLDDFNYDDEFTDENPFVFYS